MTDDAPLDPSAPTEMNVPIAQRDEVERSVALSRLKQRLFDRDVAVKIGRYHLLEVVGRGGMGVVWGAWDPELDRRVAIKLVKPSVASARDRIIVEGQALAKLSHPNVVPIYDVGLFEDQVYLVMELVRGDSLRSFASKPHTVHQLVEVYRQAGAGLAAAHAVGLVHRDFKPDNAIRGEDGRVRVLDFGLAQTADGDRGAGTPRYMAPEQRAEQAATPASDQYALCISLNEAISTPPRWIAAIIERGTHTDPAARYPSMTALVDVLGRDPARILRRRVLAGIGLVALAGAFAIGRAATGGTEPDDCAGGVAEIGAAWNAPAQTAVTAHLGRSAGDVVLDLDAYATTWAASHRQACRAHQRRELTPALYERRLACLSRSKAALRAAAELLASVPAANVDNALLAARSLPDTRRCADQDAAQIAPPAAHVVGAVDAVASSIERARILAVAVDPSAVTMAMSAVTAAEATHYTPVIARALLVHGRAEIALEGTGARRSLARSVQLAIEAGDDATAIEAFARLLFVTAEGDRVDGLTLIEPLATRSGSRGTFERALLYNNLATHRLAHGDRAGARELLLRARAELPADPAQMDIELVCISQNLAIVATTAAERESELGKAAETFDRVLGPIHAKTLEARVLYALVTYNGALARKRLAAACGDSVRLQPHLIAANAFCQFELAWLLDEVDDRPAALAAMELASSDTMLDRKLADVARAYVAAMSAPDARPAIAELRTLGQALARAADATSHIMASDAYVAAARGADRTGDRAGALTAWAAALAILERDQHPMFERRLARARAQVALHAPAEAQRLSALARAWYVAAGGYDDVLRTLP